MKHRFSQAIRAAALCLIICTVACSTQTKSTPKQKETAGKYKEFLPATTEGKKWKLVWSDEFNGTKIDESKWEIVGDWKRRDGWWVKEDSYPDGEGNLILRTKKDGDRYTCGAVRSEKKFEHRFGYWVVRCKFPKQQGHWPAFWLFSRRGVGTIGNEGRDGTEIDIMEKPWLEDKITQNLHWDGYGKEHKSAGKTSPITGVSEGFHTFGLHWKTDEYVFYVDGKEIWRTSAGGVSQVPEFIKLTEEIGKWGGDITKANLPDYFVVDYARVYDEVAEGAGVQEDKTKEVIRRAAEVRPSPRQVAWQEMELITFIHFTVNTFTDKEWGDGREEPNVFNPTQLDARQWVKACKDAGMKMIILTAKHHDGFCLWPSKYTEHSVKNSPWKNGKGDVVRELADACKEGGMKLGIYLSPWDRHEQTYGDSPKYNEYFKNQLRELLTNYGPIYEVWFDGACGEGPNGKKQVYDWEGCFEVIRELQPQAVIAISGPDVRWVGNESGVARETEWSVQPASLEGNPQLRWHPAECDVSIRPGWFYHSSEDGKVKSLEELVDIYYKSVGRNSVLLLNIPPDRRGLIHENDAKRLRGLRKALDATFRENLALGASAKASNVRGDKAEFGSDKIVDNNKDTYWSTNDWTTAAMVEFDLGKKCKFNVAEAAEYIKDGQRVEEFVLEAWDGQGWKEFARGTTIGYKRLLQFKEVTAQKVRLVILKSRICPTISNFGLYFAPAIEAIVEN